MASSPSALHPTRRAHRRARARNEAQHWQHSQLPHQHQPAWPLCRWEGLDLLLFTVAGNELHAMPTEHEGRTSMAEFKRVFGLLDAANGWSHSGAAVLRMWCDSVT